MVQNAEELSQRIGRIKTQIEQTLQRCQNAPYPSTERSRKIQALQDETRDAFASGEQALRVLEGPARELFESLQSEVQEKQARTQDISRALTDLQNVFQKKKQQHQAAVQEAQQKGQDPQPLNRQWQATQSEHNARVAELNTQLAEAQAEVNDLSPRQRQYQAKLNADVASARKQAAPDDLLKVEDSMEQILDRAGILEREIATGANTELVQEAKAEFRGKTEDFSEAETHHKDEARWIFGAMGLVLLMSGLAIYLLFIDVRLFSSAVMNTPPPAAPVTDTATRIEHALLLASGRLAILLFLAWALRYLSGLHRAHSEQAVIYRDRRAALGVAELLLNATPEIQQKREMLRALSQVYLDFETRAFAQATSRHATSTGQVRDHVKELEGTVEAIRPVLDLVGKVSSPK